MKVLMTEQETEKEYQTVPPMIAQVGELYVFEKSLKLPPNERTVFQVAKPYVRGWIVGFHPNGDTTVYHWSDFEKDELFVVVNLAEAEEYNL